MLPKFPPQPTIIDPEANKPFDVLPTQRVVARIPPWGSEHPNTLVIISNPDQTQDALITELEVVDPLPNREIPAGETEDLRFENFQGKLVFRNSGPATLRVIILNQSEIGPLVLRWLATKVAGWLPALALILLFSPIASGQQGERLDQLNSAATEAWLRGDDQAAESIWTRALQIATESNAPSFSEIGLFESLATLYQARGEFRRAAALRAQGLELRRRRGDGPEKLVSPIGDLAWSLESAHEYDDAQHLWLEQLRLTELLYANDRSMIAEGYFQVGAFFHRRGDLPKAEEYYHRAYELRGAGASETPDSP